MGGKPRTRKVYDALEQVGGEETVFEHLADGKTLTQVVEILNAEYLEFAEIPISRPILSTWCNREERVERYREARRLGALAFAEDSVAIVDDCIPEQGHVAKAKMQSDTRKWMAGKLDHDAWGDRKEPLVQLNVNEMHLEAVRELGLAAPIVKPALEHEAEDSTGEGFDAEDEDWLS